MTKPLRMIPEAEAELEAAAARYESASEGLGDRLITAVREGFEMLAVSPGVGRLVPRVPRRLCARRLLLARFPYAVVYLELPNELVVIAIAHTSRRPGYWRRRYRRSP